MTTTTAAPTTAAPTTAAPTTAAPTPGTPEHDAALVAKFEANDAAKEPRPDWLPDKFEKPEDLRKAYDELVSKFSKGEHKQPNADEQKAAKEAAKTDEQKAAEEAAKTDEQKAAEEATKAAGLDFDALTDKFAEQGALEDGDYAALEKAGIPKAVVDQYIAGQQALAAQVREGIFAEAGGEAKYAEIVGWAAKALPPAERQAFNEIVDGGDVAKVKVAVAGLKARYEAAYGREPNLIKPTGPAAAASGYDSMAQMTADMRNPRYAKDPAFRAEVEAKIAATTAF